MFGNDKEISKMRAFAQSKGAFNSKAAAFDYFFITEGKSIDEATTLANKVVAARGIPDVVEKPQNTLDKVKVLIKQGNDLYMEYPKIGEIVVGLVTGAITALGGVVIGNKLNENKTEAAAEVPKHELSTEEPKEINFE